MNNHISQLHGIIPPLVTPLNADGSLDLIGLDKLINHVIDGGVHGIFLLGTTGEATALPYAMRRELIERGAASIAGRVPLVVGISDTCYEESVSLADFAADCGALAVVATPPYYLLSSQSELQRYFQMLAARISLPLYLYNIPSCTKVSIAAETVVQLAEEPNIVGLKDSSGDMGYFNRVRYLLSDNPDFQLWLGPEELLLQTLVLGASGGISGGANLFPEIYVGLYNAVADGKLDKARRFHSHIMQVSETIYRSTLPNGYLKGLKQGLKIRELCEAHLAPPLQKLNTEQCGKIKEAVAKLPFMNHSRTARLEVI